MKPLPAQTSAVNGPLELDAGGFPISSSYSSGNRRVSSGGAQRIYPWLLVASTSVAAVFCLLYITKPVVLASQGVLQPIDAVAKQAETTKNQPTAPTEIIAPVSARTLKSPGPTNPVGMYEQTNLRIQHILSAEVAGGNLAKIDIDVPVLYQSRNLLWSPNEVAEARGLMERLTEFQEKANSVRAEGIVLMDLWNNLIEKSIPTGALRADSPSLPDNQEEASSAPKPEGLDTAELIKIQSDAK